MQAENIYLYAVEVYIDINFMISAYANIHKFSYTYIHIYMYIYMYAEGHQSRHLNTTNNLDL